MPSALAFRLRPNEEYLSVNWLEHFGASDLNTAIVCLREVFLNKPYRLQSKARFAVLNVEAVKNAVREATKSEPSIKHLPSRNDPSHAGILAGTLDELTIAVRLKTLVTPENVHRAAT